MGGGGSLKFKSKDKDKNKNGRKATIQTASASSKVSKTHPTKEVATSLPLVSVRKTPAQEAFEKVATERRRKELLKQVSKSHKERVADFNDKLSKLSEHYDIPKVGPG